jgi:hypothetical protein
MEFSVIVLVKWKKIDYIVVGRKILHRSFFAKPDMMHHRNYQVFIPLSQARLIRNRQSVFWEIPVRPPMPDWTVPHVRSFLPVSGFYCQGKDNRSGWV